MHTEHHITDELEEAVRKTEELYMDAGDSMPVKDPSNTRLYFCNINGVRTGDGSFDDLPTEMLHDDIDGLMLSEMNLHMDRYAVRKYCHDLLRQRLNHYSLQTSTSDIDSTSEFKPGGIMSIFTRRLLGRIHHKESDRLGRWTVTKFKGKREKIVTIIYCYRVSQPDTGYQGAKNTIALQQRAQLTAEGHRETGPQYHFEKDLLALVESLKKQGESLILSGDFNASIEEKNFLGQICYRCELFDAFTARHGELPFSTYLYGKKILDHLLVTADVLSAIRAIGFEAFGSRFDTDHRGLFVDLDTSALFGNDNIELPPLPSRDIHSSDPEMVTRYCDIRHKYYVEHNMFSRMSSATSSPIPVPTVMEALDRDMIQACQTAAKKCRRKARPPWSTKLACARLDLKLCKKEFQRCRMQRRLGLESDTQEFKDYFAEVKTKLRELQRDVKDLIRNARELRHEELEKKAYLLALEGHSLPAKIIRQLIRAENIKTVFLKLKCIRGLLEKRSLSNVEIPDNPDDDPKECKTWRSISCPKEIEEILIQRNKEHFNQASGTPFTVDPLRQQLNYAASTITSDLILRGEYTNEDLDKVTRSLIRYLKRCPDVPLLNNQITRDQFIDRLKSWDESTSTSPSGIHLGHYMSLIKPHSLHKEDPRLDEFEAHRMELVDFHVNHLNYAMKHGCPVERWSNIVTCMIRKDNDNSKIHRLRVIHIYEADYNLLLGVKWRELLHSCEVNGVLNDGHYGGRKGRSGHEPVWIEELEMEITRCCRRSLAKFDNDARSCYDRIVLLFAALVHRKYGLHPDVIKLHGTNLGQAQYFIKTGLGVSELSYRNCPESEVHGSGQGSTNSPTIWLVISSTLFDCHSDQAYGATFTTPDCSREVHFSMVGFVDDSTGRCNKFQDDAVAPEELVAMMTHDAQLWQDLLWSSGGDLELSKCGFSVLAYKFKKNGAPELIKFQDLHLWLRKPDGTKVRIACSPSDQAHRTLGYWKSPDGSQVAHLSKLLEKSADHGKIVAQGHLNRWEAWTYYTAIYIPSIGYALPASHFSEDELLRVQRKALPTILSKCGYACSTSRTVIFTPVALGGAGFLSLYSLQGIGQCQLVFKFWNMAGQVHNLLFVALFWAQAISGTSCCVLTDVETPLPHFDDASKWFSGLRGYLCKAKSHLLLAQYPEIVLEREHDRHIMDLVLECGIFSKSDIRMINYCRLYLQCFTLSDICTANGRHVDRHMLAGRLHPQSSTSRWIPFIQQRPSQTSWTLWRRANRLWCDKKGKMLQPLGRWLVPPQKSRRLWPFYHKPNPLGIVQLVEIDPLSPTVPHDVVPVDVATKSFARSFIPTSPPTITCFLQYLLSLAPWEQLLLQHLHFDYGSSLLEVVDILSTSPCLFSGDGSADLGIGTFGWIISTKSGQRLVAGSGYVYGHHPSSFRAEAWAQLAMVCFCVHSCLYHQRPMPTISTISDNESLVRRLPTMITQAFPRPNDCLEPDWDVTNQLVSSLRHHIVPFDIHWVKGHQDRHHPYDSLSLEAQLNVDCDRLAAAHYSYPVPDDIHVSPPFPACPARLVTPLGSIHGHFKQMLLRAEWQPKIRSYIELRRNWTQGDQSLVDWESFSRCMTKHYGRRHFLVKLIHGILPCSKIAHRYNVHEPHTCPLCSHPHEDWAHMLRCPHPKRHAWRMAFLSRLRNETSALSTPTSTEMLFITGITNWLCQSDDVSGCLDQRAADIQQRLGWDSIFLGLFGKGWAAYTIKCPQSWTIAMISFIWDELWELWVTRNEEKHGRSPDDRATAIKIKLKSQLESLYQYRDKVLARDRSFFRESVDKHLEENVPAIKQWIMLYEKAIVTSAREAHSQALQGVLPLTVYFPRRYMTDGG